MLRILFICVLVSAQDDYSSGNITKFLFMVVVAFVKALPLNQHELNLFQAVEVAVAVAVAVGTITAQVREDPWRLLKIHPAQRNASGTFLNVVFSIVFNGRKSWKVAGNFRILMVGPICAGYDYEYGSTDGQDPTQESAGWIVVRRHVLSSSSIKLHLFMCNCV